jgi:PPK2 family polyphosphate:nucleotide phosphotransferase
MTGNHEETTMDLEKFVKQFRVEPGSKVSLAKDYDPGATGGYEKKSVDEDELLAQGIQVLADYQEKLYAENSRALLVIIQALDAAGKDSAIAHVMTGVNPTGTQVFSFKAPSPEELDHDFLWRAVRSLPERGRIGIFNRSYYEEVIVVRVHPAFLVPQRLPTDTLGDGLWEQRFEEINNFEKYLVQQGTEILKIFLNVSKDEQCQRQLERIDRPEKNWKFSAGDIAERKYWDKYMEAFEDVFKHTSTKRVPWYIVPADKKWFTRLAVAGIIGQKLIEMNPKYPVVSEEARQAMLVARQELLNEDKPSKPEK